MKPKLYHLLLLAKNNEGYHNLLKLVSESHVDNFYYKPRTTFSMLQKYGHGIIGASACIAGGMTAPLTYARVDLSSTICMKAFAAAILGGIGNIPGAMIGGLLLGVIEALAAGYIAIAWKAAIAFTVLILILIIRPTGILGERTADKL